jgi:hypothetical protein
MVRSWRAGECSERRLFPALAAIASSLVPSPAWAHAGERGQVLLLPTELYIAGGALAVALSFVAMAMLPHRPSSKGIPFRVAAVPVELPKIVSTLSFLCLLLLVLAGWLGKPDPLSNPLPASIWTLWWVGLTVLTALFGNLWRILNPWIGPYCLLRRKRAAPFSYPAALGCLPALLLFLAFAWFELVYPTPQDPSRLATAIVVYWLVTFFGIVFFGMAWLERGEAFSVFFSLVARLSPLRWETARRDGTRDVALRLNWPGAWLLAQPPLCISETAFLLLALSTVSFDGLSRTFAWNSMLGVNPLEFPGRSALLLPNTLGLLMCFALLSAAFLVTLMLGKALARTGTRVIGVGSYALSLLPIAIAFHFAHYLPSLLLDWRIALRALADPFDRGWDLLGLSRIRLSSPVALDHATVTLIYNLQTLVIVLAHVAAVVTAHRLALANAGSRREAFIMQLPLTLLMIAYTVFGLWLLSTPIIG